MMHGLANLLRPEVMSLDDGTLGCEGNHRKVWQRLVDDYPQSRWTVVLEDDAVPVDHFDTQLEAALRAAPASIVSLYLGRERPIDCQPRIQRLVDKGVDAHWIMANRLLHAVGVAIRTALVPAMLAWVTDLTAGYPMDEAISGWAAAHRYPVAYTWPSLVDHADVPTVIAKHHDGAQRTAGRCAWHTGARSEWCSTATRLRLPERYSPRHIG
jgi:hypothetical protein